MNGVMKREQEARKTLTIRLPPGLYAYVKAQASRSRVSMNEWVKQVLSKGGRSDSTG